MKSNDNVFLATLTHNEHLHSRMAKAFFSHATKGDRAMFIQVQPGSLLAQSYNVLWCKAINNREKLGLKWFAMLHADIVPEDFWLDKLISLAERFDADVMSAVVPIKEASGVTSTAISGPDNFVRSTRLTQKQINALPSVFDIDIIRSMMAGGIYQESLTINVPENARLLVNTGCFVCRLDRPWTSNVEFTINDRIRQLPGGALVAEVEPEDWYFSRRVAELGGRVMATRQVITEHIGSIPYNSSKLWGHDQDPAGEYMEKIDQQAI